MDINAQKPLGVQIEEKLLQMEEETEQAMFRLLFLKNLDEETLQAQVFIIMDDVIAEEEDLTKVLLLRLMLERFGTIARTYPKWPQINASFKQQELLDFALKKDYLSIFRLGTALKPQSYVSEKDGEKVLKTDPDARSLMALTGVVRMAQQLSDRFSVLDVIEHHIGQLLNPDQQTKAVQFFQTHTSDGIFLNRHFVGVLDELVRIGDDDVVTSLLPLLDLERGSDLEMVGHWENHSVGYLATFYHLLQAEAGVINQTILNSILLYLGEYPDRLRFRAAIAVHGNEATAGQFNRMFLTSKIDFDAFVEIYRLIADPKLPPSISTTLSWINHNLIHDNVETIQMLIQVIIEKGERDSKPEQNALQNLEVCSGKVLHFIGDQLAEAQGLVACLLWKSLFRQHYANSGNPRRTFVIAKALNKGMTAKQALEALGSMTNYEITGTTVADAILNAGQKETTPIAIIQSSKKQLRDEKQIKPLEYLNSEKAFLEELYRWGHTLYYDTSTELFAAQNFSQQIAGKPTIIKALLDWTLEVLDDELVDVHQHYYLGSALMGLLARVAKDYPETLESMIDRSSTVDLLYECITAHRHFSVRMHSAAILCSLHQVDPKTLSALVNALKDVKPVRDAVINDLKQLSRIFNQSTFLALKQLLFSPNGTVAQAAAQLLGTIASQSSFDIELRKQTISALAKALREQINQPARKTLVYRTDMIPLIDKPIFKSHLESTLYNQLIALSGVKNEQTTLN
ncbi:MAG: hypothetical protein IPL65_22585 [Lewinellaceae bacterium]|nr:hypothetical protein [Lewinellaceae bacterium]